MPHTQPEPASIRIAHISDVHVYRHVMSPMQFFSKQWIGNLNLLLNRRFQFHRDPRHDLVEFFHKQGVQCVVISGDMTGMSLPSEFSEGKLFVEAFKEAGMSVLLVPGNHDAYTKQAFKKKKFYIYFGEHASDANSPAAGLSMAENRICLRRLGNKWWWLGLDTTVPAGLLTSNGEFDEALEERLRKLLQEMPQDEQIVMTNHFPLTTTSRSHDMKRLKALRTLLGEAPMVKLYLHGHVHRQSITDGRPKALPILVNSGSCGVKRNATCHIIDLQDHASRIKIYRHTNPQNPVALGHWELQREVAYGW